MAKKNHGAVCQEMTVSSFNKLTLKANCVTSPLTAAASLLTKCPAAAVVGGSSCLGGQCSGTTVSGIGPLLLLLTLTMAASFFAAFAVNGLPLASRGRPLLLLPFLRVTLRLREVPVDFVQGLAWSWNPLAWKEKKTSCNGESLERDREHSEQQLIFSRGTRTSNVNQLDEYF